MSDQAIEEQDTSAEDSYESRFGEESSRRFGLRDIGIPILSKLSKPGSDQHYGILVPTVVGYPEEGILAGILPGNSGMLHGSEALANQLHLRLVNPLSDGIIQDIEATKSFLGYLREKVDPGLKGCSLKQEYLRS